MTNGISFTKAELKAYPLLPKLQIGLQALAVQNDSYEGLIGTITEIRYGDARETENEAMLEIIVDFAEFGHQSIESSHPHLNGTGIEQVVMCEESIGIFFDENLPRTLDNKIVCWSCYQALDTIVESQIDSLTWTLVDGTWQKEQVGDSEGKRCHECNAKFDEIPEEILAY